MTNTLQTLSLEIFTAIANKLAIANVENVATYDSDITIDETLVLTELDKVYKASPNAKDMDAIGLPIILKTSPSSLLDGVLKVYTAIDQSKIKLAEENCMTDTTTATPAEPTAKPIVLKDASMLPALNSIIASATGGDIKDINVLIERANEGTSKVVSLEAALKAANTRAAQAAAASIPKTGTETINGAELTYEVIYTNASDIFTTTDATGKKRKSKPLEFQIPTLVWKDKAGAVVQHPEVPNVDETYQLQPMQLLKFLTAFAKGHNTWLYGHTGTGKSTFVEQVAARIGFPVSRVNLDGFLERSDFVGKVGLFEEGGATVSRYEEGILPRAMVRPGFLLMDEITGGKANILFVVQRVLEHMGLMLTEDGGRIVNSHPLFRFVATDNTRGQGDEYGIYGGTHTMNNALLDRFPVFIEFQYLKKDSEMKLLKDKHPTLDGTMADQMITFANELRQAFTQGEVFQPITPRGLNVLADTYLHFNAVGVTKSGEALKMALEMVVYDKTTRDTVQKVKELADRCFKVKDVASVA
jgi:cobaltochelatase CobS